MDDLRTIVLTLKNAPIGQLGAAHRRLQRAFRRLRQTAAWKTRVEAWSSSEEVTASVFKGWHPHLNVVFVGRYWDQAELAALWSRVTKGEGVIVWIRKMVRGAPTRAAIEKGIQEAVKYLVKSEEVRADWSMQMKREFQRAYRKVRLFGTGGRWRGLELPDLEALTRPEDFGELEPKRGNCPECGAQHDDWKPDGRPLSTWDADALGYLELYSFDPARRVPTDQGSALGDPDGYTNLAGALALAFREEAERAWAAGLFTDPRSSPAAKKKKTARRYEPAARMGKFSKAPPFRAA